jgi:hypothetical protein
MPGGIRRIAAVLTGGSVSGMVVLHLVHVATVAAGPTALQFLCQIGR